MVEISGYALEWLAPANIGGLFIERFAKHAFDRSIIKNPDVVCLWAHDSSRPLGRVSNGTLKLITDSIGLRYELIPNPDSPMGQEAIATVGRGDVGEVSVSFYSEVEEWTDTGDDLPERLITQAELVELSLVTWGAYGKATSATLYNRQAHANDANAKRRIAARRMEMEQKIRGIH